MARKVVVTLVDDFDGTSAADATVTFGIDGAAYEIDLSDANAAQLREVFEQWVPFARRTGRAKAGAARRIGSAPAAESTRRSDLTEIRTWAAQNGHTVSSRGRISAEVISAYEQASA
ncbi:histone-like nucleoid-structuring protein Lsr2 [Nocardia lasii]|uniref:Lsr2 family protein n=1 Tax=Nocardia lasii TaxID=1616107 RepID=A0ABW1JNA1_9NOCA